jgi:hypothetical protein
MPEPFHDDVEVLAGTHGKLRWQGFGGPDGSVAQPMGHRSDGPADPEGRRYGWQR